jgi:ornithine cyclodeaminase/alanine dehydrogenase-like protein (mu-crystallin family)
MKVTVGKNLLYLSKADVVACAISAKQMNDAVERMFRAKGEGRTTMKPKLVMYPGGKMFQAKAGVMEPFAAVKWLGYVKGNEARGFADFNPLVVVNETETGLPVAVMDGTWLSGTRTASFSAIAAKYLAKKDSSSIGFVACGLQARTNLAALKAEFPIKRIAAYSRRKETAEKFAAEARAQGIEAKVTETPREAVEDLDIVVTSVPEKVGFTSYLDCDWLAPGSFTAMVDIGRSWHHDSIKTLDKMVCDDLEQSGPGSPEKTNFEGPFHAEIGDMVVGRKPGRQSDKERNGLIFSGMGLGDVAAGALIFEVAQEKGIGTVLPL